MEKTDQMDKNIEYQKELAIKNMRSGVITGLILLGIATGKFLIAKFSDVQAVSLEGYDDYWIIGDLVFLLLLIWGITRHSRFAAITLFLYFFLSKIIQFLETGNFAIIAFSLIILFFFARAVKGTFDYHNLQIEEGSGKKTINKWVWILTTPIVLIVTFLFGLGILAQYEIIPPGHVKFKNDLTADDIQSLKEIQMISDDTKVEGFYSFGLFSVKEGGVLMTEKELIIYVEEEGEVYFDSLTYEEIDWVKQLSPGSDYEESIFQVSAKELYRGFQFGLSTDNNGDMIFFQKLKNKINPPPPVKEMPMPEI